MCMKNYLNISCRSLFFTGAFIIIFLTGACTKESVPIVAPTTADTTYKSFLALGDSYTIGESVPAETRFAFLTAALLSNQAVKINLPDYIAVTGWTTGNLLNALQNNPPVKTYDIVSLLIGVNNQYQGRGTDEYRTQFTQLLNKAIGYAGGRSNRVFVLSIPDYSVTPYAQNADTAKIAREINAFNAINKEITLQAGVSYLDITPISREARLSPDLIAGDGLHPSGKQYQRWASLLAPLIKASL